MGRGLDLIRKVVVCTLTFGIAFLGTLTVVASATRPESTSWMPLALGFVFYVALSLMPPFKQAVLRLALTALFASGALSLWFISEPPAASEPNQRFSMYIVFFAAVGPMLCGLLLALLVEERRAVTKRAMGLVLVLILFGWLVSYFSEWHTLPSLHHMSAGVIRFAVQLGSGHTLRHRRLLQLCFFGATTFCAWTLARVSGVGVGRRAAICALLAGSYAFFDLSRIHFEIPISISKSNLLIDGLAVVAVFAVCETALRARRAAT